MSSWLTYSAAAERFGVSAEAVRQIALRRKWPRRKPNDDPVGRVQVLVPDEAELRPRTPVQRSYEHPLDGRSSAEIDVWRERAERAEMVADLERERADQAEHRADAAEARADRADRTAVTERERADLADADRRAADIRADAAVARADRAEQGREGERARADALRDRLEVLQAHAEERAGRAENDVFELKGQLATAQSAAAEAGREAEAARQATHAFLDDDAARRRLGRLARLRAAWRGD